MKYLKVVTCLLLVCAVANAQPVSDEDAATDTVDDKDVDAALKAASEESNIDTIDEIPGQTSQDEPDQQPNENQLDPARKVYIDNTPVQSPFADREPQPDRSHQGMDPRFKSPSDCPTEMYKCRKVNEAQAHTRCIPNSWKCNGVRDCEENDDEDGCDIVPSPNRQQFSCSPHQHTCFGTGINGIPALCIEHNRLCDGTYDCSYGDDERNCGDQQQQQHQQQQQQYNQQQQQYHQQQQQYHQQHQQRGPPGPGQNQMHGSNESSGQSSNAHYDSRYSQQQPGYQHGQQGQQGHAGHPMYPGQQQGGASGGADCPQPSRSDEYIKRLEWQSRCFRSCMKGNH